MLLLATDTSEDYASSTLRGYADFWRNHREKFAVWRSLDTGGNFYIVWMDVDYLSLLF